MKLLTFQARRFRWKSFARTLADADHAVVDDAVEEAVVVFLHAEARDETDRPRTFRRTLKHVKWLAGKRGMRTVVLHSFAHLGGVEGSPAFARAFLAELAERLRATGYDVRVTPFGWVFEWDLAVHGEALAKVWKEVGEKELGDD
jgi:hypothetical protein